MTTDEDAYVAALVEAFTRDLVEHPVPGRVARVVIRWFAHVEPLYLTIHALGTDEEAELGDGDAWYPLEWPDVDREMERTDRVLADPALAATEKAVATLYADLDEFADGEWRASSALVEVARRIPGALRDAGVELADHMAAAAAHFEGGGARYVLEQVDPPAPDGGVARARRAARRVGRTARRVARAPAPAAG